MTELLNPRPLEPNFPHPGPLRPGGAPEDAGLFQEPAAELIDVSLVYSQGRKLAVILDRINLRMFSQNFICVLGPSGCGKTTLLNVLAGYVNEISGEVLVGGRPHTEPNPKVGVVFQHANLFPWLSVRKNIEFGLKMKGAAPADRHKAADRLLEVINLEEVANLLPHQLSGGMRQRVAIARTLAVDSEIVLLDEPFSALDALTREMMQKHLRQIWKKANRCFFFITHDVEEAILLANRIIVMKSNPGRISVDFENPLRTGPEADFERLRSAPLFSELRLSLLEMIQGNSCVI